MKIMVESLTTRFQSIQSTDQVIETTKPSPPTRLRGFVGTPHEEFHAIGVRDVNVLWMYGLSQAK